MTTDQGTTRRRMLLQQSGNDGDEGMAFRSFIGSATVQEGANTAAPLEMDGAAFVSVGLVPLAMALILMAM